MAESQKVMAQTRAVLKSTGGAAGVTAKDVDQLATSLSHLSGVDDELIASSQNVLLTFTDIQNQAGKGNDIFDQATKSILDMSVALGTDLQSATIQVGKALQDPTVGLTALRRVGVSFSDAQTEMIKKWTEQGKTLKAQKFILRELNKEFGGSAKAAGDTLPGQLSKLGNKFDELAGRVVEKMVPALTDIVEGLMGVLDWAEQNWPRFREIIVSVIDAIRPQFQRLVDYWNGTLLPAIQQVIDFAREIWARFGEDIKRNLQAAVGIIRNYLQIIKGVFEFFLAILRGDWSQAWASLKSVVKNVLQAAWTIVRTMAENFLRAALALGEAVVRGIGKGLAALAGKVRELVGRGVDKVLDLRARAIEAAADLGRSIVSGIVNGLVGLADALFEKLRSGISDAFGRVKGFFGIDSPSKVAAELIGRPIAQGIAAGIAAGTGQISSALRASVPLGVSVPVTGVGGISARPALAARGGGRGGEVRVIVVGGDSQAIAYLQGLDQRTRRGNGGKGILG